MADLRERLQQVSADAEAGTTDRSWRVATKVSHRALVGFALNVQAAMLQSDPEYRTHDILAALAQLRADLGDNRNA